MEHVRVIGLARAHPVGAELEPQTQVDPVAAGEFVPRRFATRAAGGGGREVARKRGRAAGDVLGGGDGGDRTVVPTSRPEVGVVKIFGEQQRARSDAAVCGTGASVGSGAGVSTAPAIA